MTRSKRVQAWQAKVIAGKPYPLVDALQLLQDCSSVKFDESVDLAVNLGVDTNKSEQMVRGSVILPQGTGKRVRVAVFAQGAQTEAAKAAGAELVGLEDLVKLIQSGEMGFDVVIAVPEAMPVVSKLGKLLGPRGLMPNPKDGTVSSDIKQAVEDAKSGQIRYKADKNGIIHCVIGKISFKLDALKENLLFLLTALSKAKPNTAKGIYIRKISISTTMGPGIVVSKDGLPI